MTPKTLNFEIEGFKKRRELKEYDLWLQGAYFYNALNVALSNAFSKHSKAKYPDKPYGVSVKEQKEAETKELSQAEKDRQIEQLFARLNIMAVNYNLEHKKEEQGE